MADGEGEGDPRESSNNINHVHVHEGRGQARGDRDEQESSSPDPLYSNSTSMGPSSAENGTNGLYSDESMDGQQDGPLDFSVRKHHSSIPIQNLYNKLTNGLHKKHQDHKPRTQRDYEASEDISKSNERSHYERDTLEHTLKTEAITPPPPTNGVSPVSDGLSRNSVGNSPDVAKIGEPQIAVPGMLPGTSLPGGAAGLLPMFQAGMLPSSGMFSGLQLPHDQNGISLEQNGKSSRSLKSYNKEQLSFPPPFGALPALPQMPGLDMVAAHAMAANSEEVFAHYKQYIMALQDQLLAQRSPGGSSSSSSSQGNYSRQAGSVSGMHSPTGSGQEGTPIPASTGSNPFVTPTSPQSSNRPYVNRNSSSSRKRGKSLPDALKDEAYWERRRKNNDAAKRSRDSRRAKEDQIAIRAAFLEQENLKLRVEVTALKNETAKLRCMLYNS